VRPGLRLPDDHATPPSPLPACETSLSSAVPGSRVDVVITNVPQGLEINLLFDGTAVDTEVAGSTSAGGAEPGFADVPMSFLVPNIAPGNYTLEAGGAAFRVECLAGTGGFAVLSIEATKQPGGAAAAWSAPASRSRCSSPSPWRCSSSATRWWVWPAAGPPRPSTVFLFEPAAEVHAVGPHVYVVTLGQVPFG